MATSFLSVLLLGSALLSTVKAQDFSGGGRADDAFQYIQPSVHFINMVRKHPLIKTD